MARTVTGTATFARFSLLELQVRALLREAAGVSSKTLESISKGLATPHYIHEVAVRGLFDDQAIGAELQLKIDWRQHSLALKAGGSQIQVPSTWENSVSPSLREAVRTFNEAVSQASLSTEWVVVYGDHFDRSEVNRLLGFSPASNRNWARDPDKIDFGFGPLSEASLVIGIAID